MPTTTTNPRPTQHQHHHHDDPVSAGKSWCGGDDGTGEHKPNTEQNVTLLRCPHHQ